MFPLFSVRTPSLAPLVRAAFWGGGQSLLRVGTPVLWAVCSRLLPALSLRAGGVPLRTTNAWLETWSFGQVVAPRLIIEGSRRNSGDLWTVDAAVREGRHWCGWASRSLNWERVRLRYLKMSTGLVIGRFGETGCNLKIVRQNCFA